MSRINDTSEFQFQMRRTVPSILGGLEPLSAEGVRHLEDAVTRNPGILTRQETSSSHGKSQGLKRFLQWSAMM